MFSLANIFVLCKMGFNCTLTNTEVKGRFCQRQHGLCIPSYVMSNLSCSPFSTK